MSSSRSRSGLVLLEQDDAVALVVVRGLQVDVLLLQHRQEQCWSSAERVRLQPDPRVTQQLEPVLLQSVEPGPCGPETPRWTLEEDERGCWLQLGWSQSGFRVKGCEAVKLEKVPGGVGRFWGRVAQEMAMWQKEAEEARERLGMQKRKNGEMQRVADQAVENQLMCLGDLLYKFMVCRNEMVDRMEERDRKGNDGGNDARPLKESQSSRHEPNEEDTAAQPGGLLSSMPDADMDESEMNIAIPRPRRKKARR